MLHVYDHYFQNLFLLNSLANQSQILCETSIGRRKEGTEK